MDKTFNINNYVDYRCIDPTMAHIGSPWYPREDQCACNPIYSNPTGRGFTNCPFGVTFEYEAPKYLPVQTLESTWKSAGLYEPKNLTSLPFGSEFPKSSYVPPQLQPRQLVRVGNTWRT